MTQQQTLPAPIESGLGARFFALAEEVSNDYQWDSFRVAGNAAHPREIRLFRVPQNRIGSGFARPKGPAETSMLLAGKLERPMTVTEIRYELTPVGDNATAPATAAYLLALRAALQLRFKINDAAAIAPRPLNHFHELGFSGATNNAAVNPEAVVGGVPSSRAEKLFVPAGIAGGVGFTVDLILDQNVAFLADVPEGSDYILTLYLGGKRQQIEQN